MVWRCSAKCCAGAALNSPLSKLLASKTNGTDAGAKKHHYQSRECMRLHETSSGSRFISFIYGITEGEQCVSDHVFDASLALLMCNRNKEGF